MLGVVVGSDFFPGDLVRSSSGRLIRVTKLTGKTFSGVLLEPSRIYENSPIGLESHDWNCHSFTREKPSNSPLTLEDCM